MATCKMPMQIIIDTSIIDKKIAELAELVRSRFPDGAPDFLDSQFSGLCDDIIFSDNPSTVSADGTYQVIQRIDFGRRFDDLYAAIRTGNFNAH
ncbi:hypothetical protein F9U45_10360 [Pectobacterium versatile]|uniref:hypothetical protein n=1 Tax=Pectobacterium versatile TaxID=2488639 RepID=UPI000EACFDFE|nr:MULTISPECIES: hypothetical protein [Pectobacterium]AYH27181.1 hypothetical protein C5E20_08560 [Pectobacterium parmentieri]MBQ4776224.1 hypothetical protein [Pectobacterium versatile]